MNAIKAKALQARVDAERAARKTPMLGWSTSGAQLAYVAGVEAEVASPAGAPEEKCYMGARGGGKAFSAITPEALQNAFVRAGVRLHERLICGQWMQDSYPSEECLFREQPAHEYRPAAGTSPQVLAAFYMQWIEVQMVRDEGQWSGEDTRCFSYNHPLGAAGLPPPRWRPPGEAPVNPMDPDSRAKPRTTAINP